MKILLLQILLCIGIIAHSQRFTTKDYVEIPSKIETSMMNWLTYERDNVVWSADYLSLDTSSNKINKNDFLEQLMTGKYLPLRIKTKNLPICYQLYKIDNSADKEIGAVIKQKAQLEYKYFKMEGMPLPGFDFVDLDSNIYNANITRGKVLVLNCWFIRCKPCNEEMPRLNQLVEQFQDKKDVLFLGLAFDPVNELKKFLSQKIFKYAIVADKENYLMNDLKISSYPTHLIINRQGMIVKVIDNNVDELTDVLTKEINK